MSVLYVSIPNSAISSTSTKIDTFILRPKSLNYLNFLNLLFNIKNIIWDYSKWHTGAGFTLIFTSQVKYKLLKLRHLLYIPYSVNQAWIQVTSNWNKKFTYGPKSCIKEWNSHTKTQSFHEGNERSWWTHGQGHQKRYALVPEIRL